MSTLHIDSTTRAGMTVIQAYGGSKRERGAKIGAAVRRMRAAGLTVELVDKDGYEAALGFDACTTAVYRTSVTPVVEYRVWCETGDLVHAGTDRSDAVDAMNEAIAEHADAADCEGCGVMTPQHDHGFSIQICDGDRDVTGDPSYN